MHHVVIGWVPQPTKRPVTAPSFKKLQSLIGRLDEVPWDKSSPALVAAANLFMNGAERVTVLPVDHEADLEQILERLELLQSVPDLASLAVPGLSDAGALLRIADRVASTEWNSSAIGQPTRPPYLVADLGSFDPEVVKATVDESGSWIVPVLPQIKSLLPGRGGLIPVPQTTFAQAAWLAWPGPAKGQHETLTKLSVGQVEELVDAGAAVVVPAGGRTWAMTIKLPQTITRAAIADRRALGKLSTLEQLEQELRAIVNEEMHVHSGPGVEKSIARRLTAALRQAYDRGMLYGSSADDAFGVFITGPAQVEVRIRRAPAPIKQVVIELGKR